MCSCQPVKFVANGSLIRPHPANDVHVTGTFDDWRKTEKLERVGDVFEKEVALPSADEKYYYKVRTLSGFDERTIGYQTSRRHRQRAGSRRKVMRATNHCPISH